VARNAPGVVRAATPADEMDKTVNVSVMEGLNTGVRGKRLRGCRNRHCGSERNHGVRLGTPAGAVGRSFGEALCIQLFWDARRVGYEYAGQSAGCTGLTPCLAGGRRTSSANANAREQVIAQRTNGQFLKGCRATTALVVEFISCCPHRVVFVSSFPRAISHLVCQRFSAGERRESV